MTQHSEIFNPAFDEILAHVSNACAKLGIDFYLAGAVARDYHLSKNSDYVPSRKTADIDIAVMVASENEFSELKKQLLDTGFFKEHAEPIKLIYKEAVEIDLLPFGEIEVDGTTTLTKPKVFVLEMPGFGLLNEHAEEAIWNEKINARICTIEGLVLLKLVANNDRPERTKDLIDIQQIIKLYFEVFSDDVYADHFDILEKHDEKEPDYLQKVSAYLIGRKLKNILRKDETLLQRIIKILEEDKGDYWSNVLNGLTENGTSIK